LVSAPNIILRKIFPGIIWNLPATDQTVYITFDDGPHPETTPFVLDQLRQYNARASFFLVGKQVEQYPELLKKIFSESHMVGNHGYSHLNGWRTESQTYLEDVERAKSLIGGNFFRPPYGKLSPVQFFRLRKMYTIVMWSLLAFDFSRDHEPCLILQNLLRRVQPGSILVLHENEKAKENLKIILPDLLFELKNRGYSMKKIALPAV
jgi:peptidoglycan-N-acetylglucosamine deacetylase